MSLEPTTTAKVTLITTKGAIKIDIFAKELPSTSLAFITQCHLNKFQNVSIQVTPQYISFLSPPDQPNSDTLSIVKESHSRIKCKQRGYVAYANGQWLISRGELNQANLQVFGKIDQASSWYIVNDIANGEVNKDTGELVFPVTIENSIVDVPFFKLDLKEKEEVAQGEDEKPKAKKPKVAIDYDVEEEEEDTGVDEEEGTIRIKSAYDTEKKKKRDKAQQDEVVSQADVVPESKLMSVNEKKAEADTGQKEEPYHHNSESHSNHSSSSSDSESVSDSDSDSDSESESDEMDHAPTRDSTIDSPFNPKLDLYNAESITYSELKSHKFIINT